MPSTQLTPEMQRFARNAARRLDEFANPRPHNKPLRPAEQVKGLTVRLAVRKRQRLAQDFLFTFHSTSISPLEARFEAERAAISAGWPIIGYVVDITES